MLADRARGGFEVPGEQRDMLDPVLAQHLDRVARRLARMVRHTNRADRLRVADEDSRAPFSGKTIERLVDRRRADAALLEEAVAADNGRHPVDERLGAEAG